MPAALTRRRHVDVQMELLRRFLDRLRDVPWPAARAEVERLERRLVALRAERRSLEPPRLRNLV